MTPNIKQPRFNLGDDNTKPSANINANAPRAAVKKPASRNAIKPSIAQNKTPSRRPRKAMVSAVAMLVPATRIDLHPSLGIELDEFARDNADLVDELERQFDGGQRSMPRPRVVKVGDRYLALDSIELVAAARNQATKISSFQITVLRVEAPDEADTVREQMSISRGKSGWEQYRAIAPVFEGKTVVQHLRDLGLPDTWNTTVSKVLKVGRLDPAILEAVKRFTIPVKEAGQIVDAWKDESKRDEMLASLQSLRGDTNERIDAKASFVAMLKVARPAVVEPSWRDGGSGSQEYVGADGVVLASVTISETGWIASGIAMGSAQWQAFGKNMPRPDRA